ncbi:MAG: hypothetical protein OIF47_11045 [Marinibacterium sp.]|nr:hypothetical protein [Marinibacterium sp.]
MTRFKDRAAAVLASTLSLAALGIFACLGLAVLGLFAVAALGVATADWIARIKEPKADAAQPTATA